MINTEQEFWLLSELITMEDRKLAQLCETLIWNTFGRVNQAILDQLVQCIVEAPTAIEFHKQFPILVKKIAQEWGLEEHSVKSTEAYKCKMPGPALHGFKLKR